jgi:hypothetical protein
VADKTLIFVITLTLSINACDISKPPKQIDPDAYVGCYAEYPLRLNLRRGYLLVNNQRFPYRIEFRKIGYIINSPFLVENKGSIIYVVPSSTDRFYQIINDHGYLAIIVIDENARSYTLRRQISCE